ncbi:signal peptidase I [Candidatus Woesearchaeota archaeon]|nr:signal peptidase I [Candidatus Woesearchaeota archaeon]
MFNLRSYLADVDPKDAFYTCDGTYIRNLYELLNKIQAMEEYEFRHHVNEHHDDFSNWIELVVGDRALAESLRGVLDRAKYVELLRKRIKRLELLETMINSTLILKGYVKRQTVRFGPWIVVAIVVFLILQVTYLYQLHERSNLMIRKVDQKLSNFIEKQITADNVLFKHLIGIEYLLNLTINKTTYALIPNMSIEPLIFPKPKPPKDRVDERHIIVSNRSVVLLVDSPQWSRIADTKSMEPVLTQGAHAIGVAPKSPEDIQVGDIVSYIDPFNDTVIHRVVEIGVDENGWFAVTKGDANAYEDPFKVRFNQIKRVLVAIVY